MRAARQAGLDYCFHRIPIGRHIASAPCPSSKNLRQIVLSPFRYHCLRTSLLEKAEGLLQHLNHRFAVLCSVGLELAVELFGHLKVQWGQRTRWGFLRPWRRVGSGSLLSRVLCHLQVHAMGSGHLDARSRKCTDDNSIYGINERTQTVFRYFVRRVESIAGKRRAKVSPGIRRRNPAFSPCRVVQVTSKCSAPALMKASSIARAARFAGLSVTMSSRIPPPCFSILF